MLHMCRAMAQDEQLKGVPISVDTFQAEVAAAAVAAGAHMVNDVSGGTMDPAMYSQVTAPSLSCALLAQAPACNDHLSA